MGIFAFDSRTYLFSKRYYSKLYMMSNEEFATRFKTRTKQFVIRSTNLFRALPNTEEARIFGKQYLRAAYSVGANYRAACRARSAEEFFSKISIVVEEADEACFWMEIIIETDLLPEKKVNALLNTLSFK
jgi:four helix bundle protein